VDGDNGRRAVSHFAQTTLQCRANLGSFGHVLAVPIHGLSKLGKIGSRIERSARIFISTRSITVRIGSSQAGGARGVTLIDEDDRKERSLVVTRSPQRCSR